MDGQRFAFYYALPVDCAGELTDGTPFRDVRELFVAPTDLFRMYAMA